MRLFAFALLRVCREHRDVPGFRGFEPLLNLARMSDDKM